MTVTVSTMFIPVHDPDEALVFYRDALGLEVRNDVAAHGFRWVTVGAPGQDVAIVLSQPHGGRSQSEGDALLTLVTQGSLQAAIFPSDDLDTTFEKVRASGAEVLQEPASRPWGARDCAFRDPRTTSSGSPKPDRRPHAYGVDPRPARVTPVRGRDGERSGMLSRCAAGQVEQRAPTDTAPASRPGEGDPMSMATKTDEQPPASHVAD